MLAQLEQKSAFILICSWSAQLGPIYFFLLDFLTGGIFSLYMNQICLKIYLIQVVHNKIASFIAILAFGYVIVSLGATFIYINISFKLAQFIFDISVSVTSFILHKKYYFQSLFLK